MHMRMGLMEHMAVDLLVDTGQIDLTKREMADCQTLRK